MNENNELFATVKDGSFEKKLQEGSDEDQLKLSKAYDLLLVDFFGVLTKILRLNTSSKAIFQGVDDSIKKIFKKIREGISNDLANPESCNQETDYYDQIWSSETYE